MDRSEEPPRVQRLLRQQEALAAFGTFAFREENLPRILTEAARVCAEGLGTDYSKVLRYRDAAGDLIIDAGCGWKENVVGEFVARADASSPAGRAFVTGEPVITKDLTREHDFELPAIYPEHGIVSSANVVIASTGRRPYGVLEVDSRIRRDFDRDDINFLQGFANVLAEAVATVGRLEKINQLLREKDAALAEKEVFQRELQHRVRNNLQLMWQLLSSQAKQIQDRPARRGVEGVASRVMTLAQVYDHLLGVGLGRSVDLGQYLQSLCEAIRELHVAAAGIEVTCDVERVMMDLDRTTALGLVVNELVANSYEHAFPSGTGKIAIVLREDAPAGRVTLRVGDNGTGLRDGTASGIGMDLVRRMVRQAQGEIAVEAGAGGTAWTITLPA